MEEKNALLILRLEGPLQSWGERSKWDERDSGDFPTKSGVVGLLGCALGWEREDPRLASLSRSLRMAVRADRPGRRSVDYQTVTGFPHLMTPKGPRKDQFGKHSDTFISRRTYLEDACFTVFLELSAQERERLVAALRDPKWCMYLGRKSCVPSRPVLECAAPEYATLEEALRRYPASLRSGSTMSCESEVPIAGFSAYTRPDQPMEGYRAFVSRQVWRGLIKEDSHVSVEN